MIAMGLPAALVALGLAPPCAFDPGRAAHLVDIRRTRLGRLRGLTCPVPQGFQTRLKRAKDDLILALPKDDAIFQSEAIERRLAQLAKTAGLKARIVPGN